MNRQQRRERERERRKQAKNLVIMTPEDRADIVSRAQKTAWENILPIFLLYLVQNFHCKEKGITKFMNWFNEMDAWCGGDRNRLNKLLHEVSEQANTTIEYCTQIIPK